MANNGTQTKGEKMNYPLNPAQKAILANAGENVNFEGDDNDFGCFMSQLAERHYLAGDVSEAWKCYQNDPMACYGVTFAAWESDMKSRITRHLRDLAGTITTK